MSDGKPDSEAEHVVASTSIGVVGELVKAAVHSSSVKAAGREIGQAAHTVATTINVALLPLAAINYGYERARKYFEHYYRGDVEAKLSGVSPEDIVEPRASVAGPVLQGLAFTEDEPTLKEMYLYLLASAMNSKTTLAAHPAYAEIIKQLTSDEAIALCGTLCTHDNKPIVQVRWQNNSGDWKVLLNHLLPFWRPGSDDAVEVPNVAAIIDNWIRLGLVDVTYTEQLLRTAIDPYAWVKDRPEVQRLQAEHAPQADGAKLPPGTLPGRVFTHPGVLRPTSFGIEFSKVVGIREIFLKSVSEMPPKQAEEPAAEGNTTPP